MLVRLTYYDGSIATLESVIPGTITVDDPPADGFYARCNLNRVTLQCYGNAPASHHGIKLIEQEHEDKFDDLAPLVPFLKTLSRRI